MKFFTKTPLALIAAFVILPLGACSHFSGDDTSNDRLGAAESSSGSDRLNAAPGVRSVPQFPPPNDRDLKVMTSKLSGGAVEIYDLESGALQGDSASVPSVQQDYAGIPLATDPRVTVYPVDGYGSYPGGLGGAPAMPVTPYPSAVSSMTPAPIAGAGVSNIYFPHGSAHLSGADRSALSSVAEAAKFAPVDRVRVEGHASSVTQTSDPVKAKILNLKESMNRAGAVSQELIQKGVPAEKIKTVAWGDTQPTSGGEAQQRRVDIYTAGP